MEQTLSLNLKEIDSEFREYNSRTFTTDTDISRIFNMSVYPTFKYYIGKVTLINQPASNQDRTRLLTIKTVSSAIQAKVRNLFTRNSNVLYIPEREAKHEIEPTWKDIQNARNLRNYSAVELDIRNWSKIVYAYRIFTSYKISVFEREK